MRTRWIIGVAFLLALSLGVTSFHRYSDIERAAKEKENFQEIPKVDDESISEVGYVIQSRQDTDFWERSKTIIWWVKIPATDKIYSCDWEGGYAGFHKDEGVLLIHKREDAQALHPEGEYGGYIVGLHGQAKGKAAGVWAVDVEEFY